jgi:hypothetical protein
VQEIYNAIDAAPDVVVILMILAALAAVLIVGPLAFVAGLEVGHERRERMTAFNIELVDDNARLIFEVWRLEQALTLAATRPMASVHERMATRN